MSLTEEFHSKNGDGSVTIEFFTLALCKLRDGAQIMEITASRGGPRRIDKQIPCTPGISVQHAIQEVLSVITKRLVEDFTRTGQVP